MSEDVLFEDLKFGNPTESSCSNEDTRESDALAFDSENNYELIDNKSELISDEFSEALDLKKKIPSASLDPKLSLGNTESPSFEDKSDIKTSERKVNNKYKNASNEIEFEKKIHDSFFNKDQSEVNVSSSGPKFENSALYQMLLDGYQQNISNAESSEVLPLNLSSSSLSPSGLLKIDNGKQKETPFKCEICIRFFTTPNMLERHMDLHEKHKELYCCEFCNSTFFKRYHLTEHMKIHIGVRNHSCEFCLKTFLRRSDLVKHEKIHTGERDCKCEICNKCFIRKSDLNRHMIIHDKNRKIDITNRIPTALKNRDYHCTICGKAFIKHSHLSEHMKFHLGIKNFKCEVCEKSFVRKADLNKHVLIHNRTEPKRRGRKPKLKLPEGAEIIHVSLVDDVTSSSQEEGDPECSFLGDDDDVKSPSPKEEEYSLLSTDDVIV